MWKVSMEGESDGFKLWEEGDHLTKILNVRLIDKETSKSGNPYFLWTLENKDGDKIDVRTTLLKGKRWLLKQILLACGIEAKSDDPEKKYDFDEEMVIGKDVIISIVNRESTFTDRFGKEITRTKSEVTRVKPSIDDLLKTPVQNDANPEIPF